MKDIVKNIFETVSVITTTLALVSRSVKRRFSSRRTDEDVEDDSLLCRFFRVHASQGPIYPGDQARR